MNKIVVIGSLNMDFVINVNKMPLPGETVLGKDFTLIPGGKGANQAYAIGKLGGNVSMIGAVGKDTYGERLLDNLKSVNVDVTGIEVIGDVCTGSAFIPVDSSGENSIVVVPGANAKVDRALIDRHIDLIDSASIVIMQLEIPIDTVAYACKIAKEKGKVVILDPAPAKSDLPDEIFENVDITKPNETEIKILTNINNETDEEIIAAAETLVDKGVKNVVVSLGSKGSMLVGKGYFKRFEAYNVEAVDTTAAGDSFTGALALKLSQGAQIDEAIEFAHIVSSNVVTKKGAQTSIPNMEELEEFIKKFN